MTIEGKIIEKYKTQIIKDTFKKREFVLEYVENSQYSEYIKFELIQSNCDQLDNVNVDDEVLVNFNIKGRKWTNPQGEIKYFNSLQAWRIDKKNISSQEQDTPISIQEEEKNPSQDDDLPF